METVYVVIDSIDVLGQEISLHVLEKDKVLSKKANGILSFTSINKRADNTYKEQVGYFE